MESNFLIKRIQDFKLNSYKIIDNGNLPNTLIIKYQSEIDSSYSFQSSYIFGSKLEDIIVIFNFTFSPDYNSTVEDFRQNNIVKNRILKKISKKQFSNKIEDSMRKEIFITNSINYYIKKEDFIFELEIEFLMLFIKQELGVSISNKNIKLLKKYYKELFLLIRNRNELICNELKKEKEVSDNIKEYLELNYLK
tara:strand:- start:32554 stop:33135 length:582 start_codon:yes stop_codon:yes gene_type:complete